jgi:hypothetical protein
VFEVDGHDIGVVRNNVVLTVDISAMSRGDVDWSMVVATLQASQWLIKRVPHLG